MSLEVVLNLKVLNPRDSIATIVKAIIIAAIVIVAVAARSKSIISATIAATSQQLFPSFDSF